MLKFCGCVCDGRRFGGRHSLHGSLLSCHFLGIFLFFCRSLDMFCRINDNGNRTKIPRAPRRWTNRKNKYHSNLKSILMRMLLLLFFLVIEKLREFFRTPQNNGISYPPQRHRADMKWELFGFRVRLWCGFAQVNSLTTVYHWFR